MADSELTIRLREEGAEEVKASLMDTRAAAVGVSTATLENAQAQRQAARDATVLNNAEAYKTRIFLAQHPALNSLIRSTREFATVGRSILAISTAFSTAFSAFHQKGGDLADLNGQLAQAERDYNRLLTTLGPDNPQTEAAKEQVDTLKAKIKDYNDQVSQEQTANWLNFAGTFAVIAGSMAQAIPKIIEIVYAIRGFATVLPFLELNPAFAGLFVGLGVAAAAAAGAIAGFFTAKFLNENTVWYHQYAVGMTNLFYKTIPDALGLGVKGFEDFFFGTVKLWLQIQTSITGVIDTIVKTITGMVDAIIGGVKSALDWLSKLPQNIVNGATSFAGNIGKGIGVIGSALGIPKFASGGIVTSPTLAMIGESGAEAVIPLNKAGGGGLGGMGGTVIINVQGSILAERDVMRIADQGLKRSLRKAGFTGY